MSCGCGKKKCNGKCGISPSVLQINNNECTLFHKVEIPAVMGDETTNPPKTGAYRNVLLYYEASGNSYLYSSDGIPTKLTGVVSDYEVLTNKPSINGVVLIKNKTLADLGIISAIDSAVADEATARANADNALSDRITTNANNIAANATAISNEVTARTNADNTLSARISGNTTAINNEKTARENADTALSNRITANANAISAETTARENADNALSGRITANADAISGEKTARENADAGLQDQITAVKATADSAVQPDDIDKTVMSDLAVDSNSSTAQVILKESKVNLKTGATSSEQTSLPVASSSQAGVMNSATYDAVTSNTSNINAIMNGAVAITGLPANPSQSDLTTAWQNETGLSTLINRASVYDVTNNKVWTYYTNDTTWHAASNTSSVTVNTFTNSSEGTIKGSTNIGQVFAENDGTGSVNGWDALSSDVANAKSKLSGIQSGAEVNVQSDWSVSDSSSDAYIKNKPTIGNGTLTIQKNGATIDTFTANSTTNKTVNITVPTVNDATLTIQKNGDTVQTFTANSSSNKTANIEVPTKTSELDNDAGFIANDTHQVCGEGGDITLGTTTFEPLEMNHLGGNTEQQTYSGKNLLKYPYKDTTVTRNNVTFTVNSDGSITTSGTASAETLFWFTNDTWSYNTNNIVVPAGTYTINKTGKAYIAIYITAYGETQGQIGTYSASTSDTTFTVPEKSSLTVRLRVVSGADTGGFAYSPQIESGNSATSFEPYVGGIPAPNPDYPQDIKVVTGENVVKIWGKNLYPFSDVEWNNPVTTAQWCFQDGSSTAGGGAYGANITDRTPYKVTLPAGTYKATAYNISSNIINIQACKNGTSSEIIVTNPVNINSSNPTSTITLTEQTTLCFRYRVTNPSLGIGDTKIQLEKGSATDYEPYQEQSYEVNLGNIELCKIGGYQDYIYKSGTDWKIHKEVGQTELSSSWNWYYNSISHGFSVSFVADRNWGVYAGYCSHAIVQESSSTWTAVGKCGWNASNTFWFEDGGKIATSAADFKTWLNSNIVDVYYALATPTDTEITNAALIAQLEALWEADGYDSQTNIALTYAEGNAQGILSVCQYPSHLPVATKSKLGTIIVGHGLDIEDDGRLDVIVDSALSDSSINPVQNKAITTELNSKADISSVPTKTSQLENDSGFVVNDTTEICDEGSDITLNGTLLEPLDIKKIEGATSQRTYSGKNLLPVAERSTQNKNGVTLTIYSDGSFDISGTSTANTNFDYIMPLSSSGIVGGAKYHVSSNKSIGDVQYYVHSCSSTGAWAKTLCPFAGVYATVTAQEPSTDYVNFVINVPSGRSVNLTGVKTMIEAGESATDWQPYVGGTPAPNPDYPQAVQTVTGENVVKICGKNLLYLSGLNATDNGVANTLNNDGSITCSGTVGSGWNGWTIMPYVSNLIQAGEYTLSIDHAINVGINITFRDSSNTNIVAGNIPAGSTSATVTLPRTAAKYSLWVNGTTGTAISFTIKAQLVAGSTPDYNYEPYQGQNYPIKLNAGINYWDNLQSGFLPMSGAYPTTNPSYPNAKYRLVPLKAGQSIRTVCVPGGDYGSGRARWIDPTTNEVVGAVNQGTYEYYNSTRNFGDGFYDAVITANKDVIIGFLDISGGYTQADFTIEPVNFDGIELCKIGTYQDYIYKSGGKWYVRKEIGKSILSAEGYTLWGTHPEARIFYRNSIPSGALFGEYGDTMVCPYYDTVAQYIDVTTFYNNTINMSYAMGLKHHTPGLIIKDTRFSTADQLHTWLSNNSVAIYYVLTTPTDTEITNATLIAQLEALWEADGVEGETNIFTASDGVNERAILSVCQYPSHLPIATKTKLGTIVVGHGLDIEADGKLDVIVDDDFSTESEHPVQNKVITNALAGKADNTDLSTVAMTGSYDDLTGKPTIPTVNNATLTIQKNGTNVATFTANSSTNVTANITAPVVTMTTTDPGEGGALAANNFIGVYV